MEDCRGQDREKRRLAHCPGPVIQVLDLLRGKDAIAPDADEAHISRQRTRITTPGDLECCRTGIKTCLGAGPGGDQFTLRVKTPGAGIIEPNQVVPGVCEEVDSTCCNLLKVRSIA